MEAHLADYRVQAEVVGILPRPVITRFELDPALVVKTARISNLSRDLARSLLGDSMAETPPVLEKLPYIVMMVDEFAALMMAIGQDDGDRQEGGRALIASLAQKERAAGIHLVMAPQRPVGGRYHRLDQGQYPDAHQVYRLE